MADSKEIFPHNLPHLSMNSLLRKARHWWLKRAEQHYLICASIEHERAREAEQNEAWYHKRAAMARSAQYWD